MSSSNFKVLDAQHGSFGGVSSSSSGNFILTGNVGAVAIGSSSITDFRLNSGFLYYPKVISPVLNSATAGINQVALAWSAAAAFQGLSVGGYDVCLKSGGGSYICSGVGNTTSSTQTNLTANVTYTFEIEALDALGNIIAISNELTATPTGSGGNNNGGGGGGGGGGGYAPPPSGGSGLVTVSGYSYPLSTITVFEDGDQVTTIQAASTGKFSVQLNNLSVGQHSIGFNSQDVNGRKSITVTYTLSISNNGSVALSNVIMPTTIDLSAFQLSRGAILRIFGQAPPVADVDVHVFSNEIINKVSADNNGSYTLSFNTSVLENDSHTAKSRAILDNVLGPFSQTVQFVIGAGGNQKTADLNHDSKVNIIDFSILLYWWNNTTSKGLGIADINTDGKINIVDFSIMLFQWTG